VLDERGASPIVGIQRLVAHFAHACAFMNTGQLLCWGRNTEGQHADGSTRNYGFPSRAGPSCQ
jgi:hypothetical protein